MSVVCNSADYSRRRVIIGGPQRRLLEGLRQIASRICPVTAVSSNFTVIHQAVRLLNPDVVVIDAAIACWELESIVSRIGNMSRDLRILALIPAGHLSDTVKDRLPKAGFVTLLAADVSEELFHETLLRIIGGQPDPPPEPPAPPETAGSGSPEVLTPRQRDILRLICSAESTKGIARILDISTRTVEFHKYRMMKTLAVNTMAELILFGVASGLGAGPQRTLPFSAVDSRGERLSRQHAVGMA
ncbi:MAG TPA: LuxR C-terminal-related transcriptional regulator [Bryobacteraceae bacterium]|nr:LuxR C-terminal-related transcriptional regulator [Bryobacteraceae bacterium]